MYHAKTAGSSGWILSVRCSTKAAVHAKFNDLLRSAGGFGTYGVAWWGVCGLNCHASAVRDLVVYRKFASAL
jgi:hypothetical protein